MAPPQRTHWFNIEKVNLGLHFPLHIWYLDQKTIQVNKENFTGQKLPERQSKTSLNKLTWSTPLY
jgi:hypothetical protein